MNATSLDCARVRERIHAVLDGALDATGRAALDAHLATCAACRELDADLALLRAGLGDLAEPALPDDALAAVWERTVERPRATGRGRLLRIAPLAAAALLAFAILVPALQRDPQPTPEELARAAAELQLVFRIADKALDRSRSTAFREMQAGIARVPVFGPAVTGATPAAPIRAQ